MEKIFILAIVLSAIACTPKYVNVYIDPILDKRGLTVWSNDKKYIVPTFVSNTKQIETIVNSAKTEKSIYFQSNDFLLIVVVDKIIELKDSDSIGMYAGAYYDYHGLVRFSPSLIQIDSRYTNVEILAHEYGHYLGYDHEWSNQYSVMYPFYIPAIKLSNFTEFKSNR